jgi:hypothetical protein
MVPPHLWRNGKVNLTTRRLALRQNKDNWKDRCAFEYGFCVCPSDVKNVGAAAD